MAGFDYRAFNSELDRIAKGDLKQFFPWIVDVSATGVQKPIEVDMNSIELMKQLMLPDGTIVASDAVAHVWLRFNRQDNPWIPFSMVANNADKQVANLAIRKIWVRVDVAGTGTTKFLAFLLSLNASLSGVATPANGGVSGGGYVSNPSNSGGA